MPVSSSALSRYFSPAVVNRNVEIKNSTGAIVIQDSQIDGNVEVEDNQAESLRIGSFQTGGNTINGNVTVEDNTAATTIAVNGGPEGSGTTPTHIGGDVTVANNHAGTTVQMILITVGGNIEMTDNTAEGAPLGGQTFIWALSVTVDGNLACEDNDPNPAISGNNVSGNTDCSD